jgi:hypothetical protein
MKRDKIPYFTSSTIDNAVHLVSVGRILVDTSSIIKGFMYLLTLFFI